MGGLLEARSLVINKTSHGAAHRVSVGAEHNDAFTTGQEDAECCSVGTIDPFVFFINQMID